MRRPRTGAPRSGDAGPVPARAGMARPRAALLTAVGPYGNPPALEAASPDRAPAPPALRPHPRCGP